MHLSWEESYKRYKLALDYDFSANPTQIMTLLAQIMSVNPMCTYLVRFYK